MFITRKKNCKIVVFVLNLYVLLIHDIIIYYNPKSFTETNNLMNFSLIALNNRVQKNKFILLIILLTIIS